MTTALRFEVAQAILSPAIALAHARWLRIDLIGFAGKIHKHWTVEREILRHASAVRCSQVKILAAELRHVDRVLGLFRRHRGILPGLILLEERFLSDLLDRLRVC